MRDNKVTVKKAEWRKNYKPAKDKLIVSNSNQYKAQPNVRFHLPATFDTQYGEYNASRVHDVDFDYNQTPE